VAFDDVSFRYPGSEREILRGVSFVVEPGRTVAILGTTGSGKSTLVNLLPRFYDATGGAVRLDGHDVRDVTLTSLRSQIGMVLQEARLFSGTVRDNVAFGKPDATDEEVRAAAKDAQADGFIRVLSDGYETVIGERGVGLSGGQRQRIAIARALLVDPRLLILDDSTSAPSSWTNPSPLAGATANMPRFVIQEHYATSHHFDLRLERDGVLVSWAIPKGMPESTKKNRLAVRVEDHDLSHLDLVDETPVEGVPGAVRKSIWDGGSYEVEEFGRKVGRIEGRVTFENVTFAYEPGRPVLRDVDFEVAPGQTVALVGPTGAGKTTIASLIPRFYDATNGAVNIDGRDVRAYARKDLRENIGIVLQESFLFSGTIADNIGYGRLGASREEIEAAARTLDAHGFISELPDGYDTELGEGGGSLSQGQRQLLSFARAVLTDPRILILDEATSNIDTRTEKVIQNALATLLKGRTSVVIAHRLSTIRNADLILAVGDGRVVERGTHEELLARGGLYADLYRRQFRRPVLS
jgi:DNA ligase D-like protein (predicted 3'-phosphoesterase)